MSVDRYIRPVRWLGLRCPGERRVRQESSVPNVTHHPLAPCSMASVIGEAKIWITELGTDGYGGIRLGLVRYGWDMVRFGCVRYQLLPRGDHGGTYRSTLNAAETGQPVSWDLAQRSLCECQSGESDAEPSLM